MKESAAQAAIETVVRQSYGQIIAYLAARSGDLTGAEDALSDAFLAALRRWPRDGVPDRPEAWLLRVARNRLIDSARHDRVRSDPPNIFNRSPKRPTPWPRHLNLSRTSGSN